MKTRTLSSSVLGLALVLAACGDDPRRPGGGSDGGIVSDGSDDGTSCGTDTVSPVRDMYCSSTTASCVDACDTGDCIYGCLDSDPNPDCSACVNINIVACGNSNGCQGDWDEYTCCIEGECGADAGSTCVDTAVTGACAGDSDRYDECLNGVAIGDVCPNVIADCF